MFELIFCCIFLLFSALAVFVVVFFYNYSNKLKTNINIPFRQKTYFTTEHIYLVTFITGQRPGAGTLANIYLRLHGDLSSSDIFKIDDINKGLFQRGSIDSFLIFTAEPLGIITRVELQIDARGRHDQDWFLAEVTVQDPISHYKPYIFTCRKWFKSGGYTYKHFIVEPKTCRILQLRSLLTNVTRGMKYYNMWLGVFCNNRRGRRFNGCMATAILFQLLSNLILFSTVPAVIPEDTSLADLIYYTFPFNLLAFITATFIEIIGRNTRPKIICTCPFHHDWDTERVAYRNALKVEIARKPLNFTPNPTYPILYNCLTQDEWRRARSIARDTWRKIRKENVTDDIIDDLIKAYLYRAGQKMNSREGEMANSRRSHENQSASSSANSSASTSESGSSSSEGGNRNQSALKSDGQRRASNLLANMGMEFSLMLKETNMRGSRGNQSHAYTTQGSRYENTKGDETSESYNSLNEDQNLIYSVRDDCNGVNDDTKACKDRLLFMSDLEFVVKSPGKDTLAFIKLHNSLSKAVAYDVTTNNQHAYEIQPNIGLIKPQKTVEISVLLQSGYDVRILDNILITAKPVDTHNCDPAQIRWLWRASQKYTILKHVVNCRGIIPREIKEPLDLTTGHLLQLELEMGGEHTKYFVPWTVYLLYTFCTVQGIIALLMASRYSLGMDSKEMRIWLNIFGISVLQHVLGFENLKVVLLAIGSLFSRKNWLDFT